MGFFKVEIYDGRGYARNWDADWAIYAAFAPVSQEQTLVKVGCTGKIYSRISTVATHCPFPLEMTLWTHVGGKSKAYHIEAALHDAFAAHHKHGEWFSFNMAAPADKLLFHQATREIIGKYTGGLEWKKISREQLAAYRTTTTSGYKK